MKLARANCANAMADRQSGQDRHEKTECARTLCRAKSASRIARKIKSQIKASSRVAYSYRGWEKIAAKRPQIRLWERLTVSRA